MMSDLDKILVTAATTVIGGLVILVMGQIVIRFILEPILEYRKVVAGIAEALLHHAHFFADSGPDAGTMKGVDEAAAEIRRLAVELNAKAITIPGYRLLGWLRVIRPYQKILDARRTLWGLANGMFRSDWQRKMQAATDAAKALAITAVSPDLLSQDWSEEALGSPRT